MDYFAHSHRVPYSECTLGNHVYYARYLDILEEARGEFFRHLGKPLLELQNAGQLFPVTEVHLEYKGAARYDDVLEVRVRLLEITRIRLRMGYEILRDSTLLVQGETVHVSTSLEEKPKRIPQELLQVLEGHLVRAKEA